MRKALYIALSFAFTVAAADDKRPTVTAQVQRGRELFASSAKTTACSTCHALAGIGTAVGPDLRKMAADAPPHGLVLTILMTMTENVQLVKTAGGSFPAILSQKTDDGSEFWDLSQTPPVARKLPSKQILSMERDQKWQHPPTGAEYTAQELADIIGFLRWAATGSVKEVKIVEVGDF